MDYLLDGRLALNNVMDRLASFVDFMLHLGMETDRHGRVDFFSYAKIEKVGACSEYINSHLALDHQHQLAKTQAKVSLPSFDTSN